MLMKTSQLRIALVQTLIINKSIFTRSIQNYHTLPRLFIPSIKNTQRFDTGIHVPLSEDQIHYVSTVLRLGGGSTRKRQSKSAQQQVRIFNGVDGEWIGAIQYISKNEINVECTKQLRPQTNNPNGTCWVIFAPIQQPKRLKYMIEKCTEMGVDKFIPILSERVQLNNSKWNSLLTKWRAIAIEASEQCERLDIPSIDFSLSDNTHVDSPFNIKEVLHNWKVKDTNRLLYICCERNTDNDFFNVMNQNNNKNIAFAIGPEGGWSETELELIHDKRDQDGIQLLSLGRNVLRAETAAIVSVAGWSLWCDSHEE